MIRSLPAGEGGVFAVEVKSQSALRKPGPGSHVSVHCLFLQQTSRAETECLKISCSCVLVSSTMEYLSNERTFPETCAPFSNWTVMCFPPARATLRNDSWTLITDMIEPLAHISCASGIPRPSQSLWRDVLMML